MSTPARKPRLAPLSAEAQANVDVALTQMGRTAALRAFTTALAQGGDEVAGVAAAEHLLASTIEDRLEAVYIEAARRQVESLRRLSVPVEVAA